MDIHETHTEYKFCLTDMGIGWSGDGARWGVQLQVDATSRLRKRRFLSNLSCLTPLPRCFCLGPDVVA